MYIDESYVPELLKELYGENSNMYYNVLKNTIDNIMDINVSPAKKLNKAVMMIKTKKLFLLKKLSS